MSIKNKIVQISFSWGIGLDQLTPMNYYMVFVEKSKTIAATDDSKHIRDFKNASSFSKQNTNYGRRKRNKSV